MTTPSPDKNNQPAMQATSTAIADVLILQPRVFGDERGFFMESHNRRTWAAVTGLEVDFVQDNHSRSAQGVLRGLHYQVRQAQGKLVRVIQGAIFDVAVDIRSDSPTFGRWVGVELTAANHKQLWIPAGLAHGFLVLSDSADVLYKATDYYAPEHERSIRWDDPDLAIDWPLAALGITEPLLSDKDRGGALFAQADLPA